MWKVPTLSAAGWFTDKDAKKKKKGHISFFRCRCSLKWNLGQMQVRPI